MDGEPTPSDPLESTTSLVRSVFRTVWRDFFAWESTYCQDAIDALACSSLPDNEHLGTLGFDSHTQIEIETESEGGSFSIWDYSSSPTLQARLPVENIICIQFDPHPTYESCAPCARAILVGDDPDNMPFIPFVDDPEFDYFDHMWHYKQLAWQDLKFGQETIIDPDRVAITIETVYRLYSTHNIPLAHIDETGVLPQVVTSQHDGVLRYSRQRDLLKWPGATATPSFLFLTMSQPEVTDFRSRFESITVMFCPNLNCIQGYCTRHLEPMPIRYRRKPADFRHEIVRAPCGSLCFLQNQDSTESTLPWSQAEKETLRCVLDISPDIKPCDLAMICRKSCREIRHQMMIQDGQSPTKPKPIVQLTDISGFREAVTSNDPCNHHGLCDANHKCICALNHIHCSRNCACEIKCKRRWPGCQCKSTKLGNVCSSKRCPCYLALRECDPELCRNCQARDADADICQNASIQQGRHKNAEVKRCQWGLGLFLTEPAKEGELIAEYVGELIFELTTQSRDDLSTHRRRNYLFGLDSTLSIDSTYVGNQARYINHAESHLANSIANVSLVNGEPRLGIYALKRIEAGAEVVLDYGDEFFKKNADQPL